MCNRNAYYDRPTRSSSLAKSTRFQVGALICLKSVMELITRAGRRMLPHVGTSTPRREHL